MAYTEDIVADSITLDDTQTLSNVRSDGHLTVSTERASRVLVWIDDGTTGNKPAQYTLTHQVEKMGTWRFDGENTNTQSRSFEVSASGPKWRIDIKNTSGNDSKTYRIVLESRVEDPT